MERETPSSLLASRCGHCGAGLRDDAPWCTLCLTPTGFARAPEARPEPQPELTVVDAPVGRHAAPSTFDPLTAPLELLLDAPAPAAAHAAPAAPAQASWPCTTCETANPLDAARCTTCGAGFLEAVVREEPPLLVLPLLGDVTQWNKVHWLCFGAVLLVVLVALVLVLGTLLG